MREFHGRATARMAAAPQDKRRFAYETRNADGNPSRTRWAWEVAAAGTGTEVTVTWDCYLKTADRRLLAGPMRKRQLAREVPRSLSAIDSAVRARAESAG